MSDPTRADDSDPDRTKWVGRAKPSPPPPSDPWPTTEEYYPPVEPAPVHYVQYVDGYPPAMVRPPKRRRRSGGTVLIVLLALFTLCCGGGIVLAYRLNGGFSGTSAVGNAPPPPPGLGDPVADGDLTFVVSAVNCGQTSVGRLLTQKAKGQFCIVDLTVENKGTSTQSVSDVFQKLVGSDGTVYDADVYAGVLANENINGLWSRIGPGSKVAGKIVYDVPAIAKIAKVELHDSPLSSGATVTL